MSLSSLNRLTMEGASGMALVDRGFDNPMLYLAADGKGGPQLIPININDTGPSAGRRSPCPAWSATSSGTSRPTSST